MSTSRGNTRDDAEHVITAEVPLKITDAVNRIGTALGVRLPIPNDEVAAAAQEYYVANELVKAAEGRKDKAKSALVPLLNVPSAKGKHVVHDSRVAVVTADQRSAPRRLNEEAVINMICKRFKLGVDEAKTLVDECKLGGEGYVTHYSVVLK